MSDSGVEDLHLKCMRFKGGDEDDTSFALYYLECLEQYRSAFENETDEDYRDYAIFSFDEMAKTVILAMNQ